MIRMRHAGQVQTRPEANEIILINSHDGASSYQMLAGMFRFVCCNGLVVGKVVDDIRIPHKGNIQGEVIEGAFRVLDEFEAVNEHTEAMKALQLQRRPGARCHHPQAHRSHGAAACAAGHGQSDGWRAWHDGDRCALPLHQQERTARD
jgi:hypothetical protein